LNRPDDVMAASRAPRTPDEIGRPHGPGPLTAPINRTGTQGPRGQFRAHLPVSVLGTQTGALQQDRPRVEPQRSAPGTIRARS